MGAGVLLASLPNIASAHLVSTRFGELYSGMLHPLTTLQHLLPWVGLALLGGLLGASTSRWSLAVFPSAVLLGSLLAPVLGPASSWASSANLVSIAVIGLLVAMAAKLGRGLFVGLCLILGISHGIANANPDLTGFPHLLYSIGVALAAYLLITLTTGLFDHLAGRFRWGCIALRAGGSWILAAGLVFGGYTLMLAT